MVGPSGPIPPGQPYDVRVTWDLPPSAPGDIWYGTAILGTSPATPGNIGSFPVTLHRAPDDVTKTASVGEAVAGDTIDYEITVQPNVTDTDLVYTIVDTVPNGLTIDPASVTGGGVVDGQTITWEVTMPTAFGVVGDYVASTPATSPQCAANAGFVDLGAPPFHFAYAGVDGDSVAASAFSNIGPFEHYGQQFANLVVSDDGLVTVAGGYGGAPWEPQAIPHPAPPNGVIAPLWSDLELSVANERGIILASAPGVAVIQWDNLFEYNGDADTTVGPSVGSFEAWVYTTVVRHTARDDARLRHLAALPDVATIGVEDILGEQATAVLRRAGSEHRVDRRRLDLSRLRGSVVRPGHAGLQRDRRRQVHCRARTPTTPCTSPTIRSRSRSPCRPPSPSTACTRTITRTHLGALTVSSGTTCINGALVVGKVTVKPGAGLVITNGSLLGTLTTTGAKEVTICGSGSIAAISIAGSSAVRLGDPVAGCRGERVPRIGEGDGHGRADRDRREPDHRTAGVHRQQPAAHQQRRAEHRLRTEVRSVQRAVAPTTRTREVSAP